MLLALHSLLFQGSSSADANVSINGNNVISYGGNSVVTGTSLVNVSGSIIVPSLGNINIDADANILVKGSLITSGNINIDADANILVKGSLITSELGNILEFAKYKISKFNKNEKNLIFDIINKETIKLILENK